MQIIAQGAMRIYHAPSLRQLLYVLRLTLSSQNLLRKVLFQSPFYRKEAWSVKRYQKCVQGHLAEKGRGEASIHVSLIPIPDLLTTKENVPTKFSPS